MLDDMKDPPLVFHGFMLLILFFPCTAKMRDPYLAKARRKGLPPLGRKNRSFFLS